MCYQERYQGAPTEVTTCRASAKACHRLAQRVKRGTSVLIAKSQSRSCTAFSGAHPAVQLGKRSAWIPSKKPGAWWTPAGCLLPKLSKIKSLPSQAPDACSLDVDTSQITVNILSLKFEQFEPSPDDDPSDCNRDVWSGLADLIKGGKAICTFEFSTISIEGPTATPMDRELLKRRFIGTTRQGSYDPTGQCWPELSIE